jgi:hypothetical protein
MRETTWSGITAEEWLTYNPQPPVEWMEAME